jgi:hypothetical protein
MAAVGTESVRVPVGEGCRGGMETIAEWRSRNTQPADRLRGCFSASAGIFGGDGGRWRMWPGLGGGRSGGGGLAAAMSLLLAHVPTGLSGCLSWDL